MKLKEKKIDASFMFLKAFAKDIQKHIQMLHFKLQFMQIMVTKQTVICTSEYVHYKQHVMLPIFTGIIKTLLNPVLLMLGTLALGQLDCEFQYDVVSPNQMTLLHHLP